MREPGGGAEGARWVVESYVSEGDNYSDAAVMVILLFIGGS